MKTHLALILFLILLSCEDKQSAKNKVSTNVSKTAITSIKKDSILQPKREFPKLNDKNVIPFFLEYSKKNKENKVRIYTDFGNIDILLFDKTKYHRANFIFLTKQNYFDRTQFYRIVNNFVIQGGNSDEQSIALKRRHIGRYLLPIDTKHGFKHNRGVISMPSSDIDNPYKLASPYQFFIVQSKNGAHHLDGSFTAFGKVIKGMNVVDKIAAQKTDNREWPLQNVYIRKIRIIE